MLCGFHELFLGVAAREQYVLKVRDPGGSLPAGEYTFYEHYCVEPDCDCRRVLLRVVSSSLGQDVAFIGHAFEPPKPGAFVHQQTYLEPTRRQSPLAVALLEEFHRTLLKDEVFCQRLRSHYKMVKDAIAAPSHRVQGLIAAIRRLYESDSSSVEVGPYEPCPCGSGEKYKWCCRKRR